MTIDIKLFVASEMKDLRVLIISSFFYPDGGGAGNYVFDIAKRLVKKGHTITVVCSNSMKKNKEEIIEGIKIKRLKPDGVISTMPIKLNLLFKIVKIIRSNDFDLVNINFHLPFYSDIAAIASKICRIPCILTYHNDILKDTFPMNLMAMAYNYFINYLTLHLAHKIITPSPYCYNESKFLRRWRRKVVCVPPGIELEKYEVNNSFVIHTAYNLPRLSKVILFVGQMSKAHRHKGVDYLIEAFARVLDNIKDAYLILVGTGNMITKYKAMCRSLGILKHVIFAGFLERSQLIEYYKSAQVLVLPSTTIQEGFGMVLIEANACGKPVIGTKIGGIQYIVKEGENGLLVPPKNPEALADAITEILQEDSTMFSKSARRIAENYQLDKIVEETERVYLEAAKR